MIIAIGSAVGSGLAIVFSGFRVWSARSANKLAASSPWAAEVIKLVTTELQNAVDDRNMVRIFCTVPFKAVKDKKKHRDALNELRDVSQRTIFAIDCYTNRKTSVQATKAARDKIDDSYWDNSALTLDDERGLAKLAEYEVKADAHVAALMLLMDEIATDKRLALLPSAAKRKELSAAKRNEPPSG